MSDVRKLQHALNAGLKFLHGCQQPDGSFLSLSSPSKKFENPLTFHSVFSTALISQSLSKISDRAAVSMNEAIVAFLLEQKSDVWSWNYWQRGSGEAKKMAYPDDLDDTFCALAALSLYDQKMITGEVLANAVNILTSMEVQEGGPYKTWLVLDNAPAVWKDIDLGVNANIAYFLHLQKISLPHLTDLFDKALAQKKFTTPYYPSPLPILYFLSRFIRGRERKRLLAKNILETDASSSLDVAVKISALIHLGSSPVKLNDLVATLIASQEKDGGWEPAVFYTGVNPLRDKMFFAGSRALTTAFCVEAIHLYGQKMKTGKNPLDPKVGKLNALVLTRVEERFSGLGMNLQNEAKVYLRQIIKSNGDQQVTLLPLFFALSLGERGKTIPDELLVELGAASVFGWLAYTLYDNFLDDEGVNASLPLANTSLRELTTIFNSVLPVSAGFQPVFRELMDVLEEANTWEMVNCRDKETIPDFGDYAQLANKSLGHSLGCVAVLMSLGFGADSPELKNLLAFFRHFLIARQLNDDAHDWEADLRRGHVNSVGAMLLSKKPVDLQKVFWEAVVDDVCELILLHCARARDALADMKVIEQPALFLKLVEKQEKTVEITRKEKAKALDFLAAYSRQKI